MNDPDKKFLTDLVQDKRILFVATKNADYIRISQEKRILEEKCAVVETVAFYDKSYFKRVCRVYAYLLFHSLKEYDAVFIGFMAQMILPVFWWRFGKKVVITDFFISIYDTLVYDRKKVSEGSFLAKFLKAVDKRVIRISDYIITDTKEHGKYFTEELGADQQKILSLYLEADQDIYFPRNVEKPEEYRDKCLVFYFGSILPLQGVEVILKCIEKLQDNDQIHFIMVGPIEGKYKKPETGNVTYISWLSQEELADYIAFADLCLGGHFSNYIEKARRTIPGKVYIYQAMEKRMILGDSPANRELFKADRQHIFVPMGDSEKLAAVVSQEWEVWKK